MNFNLFSLFMLITIMILYASFLPLKVLASPPIDRQEIQNSNVWAQIPLPQFSDVIIHDGRKLYFNTATDISQCKSSGLLNILPNLTSVSYFSNGKSLNSTFWLSRPPLTNYRQFLNTSSIHQVYLRIDIQPYQNKTLPQLIAAERNLINKEYIDVKIVNKSDAISLNNNLAYKLVFTGRLNYSDFGHPAITAMDIGLIAKNDKIYRIRYIAEPTEFPKYIDTINDMVNSLHIINNNNNNNSSPIPKTIPEPSTTTMGVARLSSTYSNLSKGLEIKYPSNWEKIDKATTVIFYSPIAGPYMIGNLYVMSIDVPSVYNALTDFEAKTGWWDTLYNQTWFKRVQEVSSQGTPKTLELNSNFKNAFEKGKNYVYLPLNFTTINSPNQYLMIFGTEVRFIENGLLCELIQFTNQVSSPPPEFSIIPSSNSSSLGPGEEKTIEVKIQSHSNIPSTISLYTNSSTHMLQEATFSPSVINIPPSGWATAELTIKSKWDVAFKSGSITETIPIIAKISFPQKGNFFIFNTNKIISSPAAVSTTASSGLAITLLNFSDYVVHLLTSLSSPINVLIPLAGLVGGSIAWFLKRSSINKNHKGRSD